MAYERRRRRNKFANLNLAITIENSMVTSIQIVLYFLFTNFFSNIFLCYSSNSTY